MRVQTTLVMHDLHDEQIACKEAIQSKSFSGHTVQNDIMSNQTYNPHGSREFRFKNQWP